MDNPAMDHMYNKHRMSLSKVLQSSCFWKDTPPPPMIEHGNKRSLHKTLDLVPFLWCKNNLFLVLGAMLWFPVMSWALAHLCDSQRAQRMWPSHLEPELCPLAKSTVSSVLCQHVSHARSKKWEVFPFTLSVIVFTADAMKSVKACVGLQQQVSAMLDSVEEREGWIVKLYCVFVCHLSLQIDFNYGGT